MALESFKSLFKSKSNLILCILTVLLHSILKNPTEDKFRILKKSNKTIAQKLLGLQPSGIIIQLIETLGYTSLDDEIHAFAGDYFVVLMEGCGLIEQAIMKIKIKTMSAEEKAKHELIQKNNAEYKAKMKADAEHKRQLEEDSHKDRKVK